MHPALVSMGLPRTPLNFPPALTEGLAILAEETHPSTRSSSYTQPRRGILRRTSVSLSLGEITVKESRLSARFTTFDPPHDHRSRLPQWVTRLGLVMGMYSPLGPAPIVFQDLPSVEELISDFGIASRDPDRRRIVGIGGDKPNRRSCRVSLLSPTSPRIR